MVFFCSELLFKMPLIFINEKHGDMPMYAVSAVEIVDLLQWNTSSDTSHKVSH